MAEAEDSEQPARSEGLVLWSRATAPSEAPAPEATLDPSDRDVWMEPAEAAAWVCAASRNALSLDDAARELARAASERRLTSLQWSRRIGVDTRTEPRGYLRAHVLELWPRGGFLTVYEAHGLIEVYTGMRLPLANEWLHEQMRAGVVQLFCETPMTDWASSLPLPELQGSYSDSGPPRERLPHAKHWRFLKDQLIEAVYEYRRTHEQPWRTRVPKAPSRPWISHSLARGMVAHATGYDPEAAVAWLTAGALSAEPPLRARFSPRALAELERKSPREKFRAMYPSMIAEALDDEASRDPHPDRGGNCLWFHPGEALASGTCPESGLPAAQVEWHADELKAALAREFPAGGQTDKLSGRARPKGAPGRPPQDKWVAVLVETGLWLAKEGDPGTDEAVANFMATRFAERGWEEPSRETRRAMARLARDTFGLWRAGAGIS